MNARAYCTVSALAFTVVALGHLLRGIAGWPIVLGSWQLPPSASLLVGFVAAAVAAWGFRLAARTTTPA